MTTKYAVIHAYFGHKNIFKVCNNRHQAEKIANEMEAKVLDKGNEGYGVRTALEWWNETRGLFPKVSSRKKLKEVV
jgi:hypothetical protein